MRYGGVRDDVRRSLMGHLMYACACSYVYACTPAPFFTPTSPMVITALMARSVYIAHMWAVDRESVGVSIQGEVA